MKAWIVLSLVKELRHQRWWVAALWLLCVAQGVIEAVVLRRASNGVEMGAVWMVVAGWLFLPKLALVFVLIGRMVQGEKLARGKSSLRVLAVKLAAVGMGVLLPLLVENWLVLGTMGMEWSRVTVTSLETALVWGCPILGLMLLASLTTRFAWYVGACVVSVVGLLLSVPAYATLRFLVHQWLGWEWVARGGYGFTEVTSAALVLGAVMTLSAVILLALHYATGHPRLTIYAMAILWLGCLLATDFCRWDLLEEWSYRGAVSGEKFAESAVAIQLDRESARTQYVDGTQQSAAISLSLRGLVKTEDGAHLYVPSYIRSRWLVEGKPVVRSKVLRSHYAGEWRSPEMMKAMLPGVRLLNALPPKAPEYRLSCMRFSEREFFQWKEQPGTLAMTMDMAVWRYRKLGELPLRAGAELSEGSTRVVLCGIKRSDRPGVAPVTIYVAETHPSKWMAVSDPYYSIMDQALHYVLYNPRRNEVYLGNIGWSSSNVLEYPDFRRRSVVVQPRKLGFPLRDTDRGIRPEPISEEWLSEAVLVCVRAERVGNVSKEVEVLELVLGQAKAGTEK
ncbi:MAG: hypothetical protein B9S32_03910 [Verrucomicrobia bacterium Tous-C9LFEB]|nr:MAG: hypothetical protein B9S32_03910 [Verrucomicrobia bacterium Tous-C9LFEB]